MGDQQFFLKWNDFQTNMVTSFRHLRDEKSFTDVSMSSYLKKVSNITCDRQLQRFFSCTEKQKVFLIFFPITHITEKSEVCSHFPVITLVPRDAEAER